MASKRLRNDFKTASKRPENGFEPPERFSRTNRIERKLHPDAPPGSPPPCIGAEASFGKLKINLLIKKLRITTQMISFRPGQSAGQLVGRKKRGKNWVVPCEARTRDLCIAPDTVV